MSQQWDINYLIGVGTACAVALVCVVVATVGLYRDTRGNGDGGGTFAAICAGIVFLIAVGVGLYIATPFSGQYHRFQPLGGVVTKTGSRFIASDTQGGGSTQKYVVTFRDGLSLGCLDTRCANVTAGDNLTLMCERVFQFNAPSEGWDCNWGTDRKPDGSVIP